VPRNKIGKHVLKTLSLVFGFINIQFSDRYNAIYGKRDFFAMLVEMCHNGATANGVSNEGLLENAPSGRWFRDKLKSISYDDAMLLCDTMITTTVKMARRGGMLSRGYRNMIAIDKHLIPRYDKNNMHKLIYSAWKRGTKRFECYATMQVVAGPINAVIAGTRVTRDDSDTDVIRKFLNVIKQGKIVARFLLMDREFFSVDIMRSVMDAKFRFLMPAIRTTNVKKAIMEYHKGKREKVSQYTVKNSEGREAEVTLIIVPSKDYDDKDAKITSKYMPFVTNMKNCRIEDEMTQIPEEYKSRWGIETAYRQIEQARPKTFSRDGTLRLILFFTALLIYNMWAIERAANKDVNPKLITIKMITSSTFQLFLFEPRGLGPPQ